MSTPIRKTFDYNSLDTADAQFVQQQTDEIRVLMKRTAQDIVEIGRKLIQVKKRLEHGRFSGWLDAEFDWSIDTAQRFMQVARVFDGKPQVAVFAPSALYLLAAPSTPEAGRKEALARAEAGESITYTKARAIKQKHSRSAKLKSKSVSQPDASPSQEIVEVRAQEQVPTAPTSQLTEEATDTIASVSQTSQAPQSLQPVMSVRVPEQLGTWWQLEQHLLYCGDPNLLIPNPLP